MSLNKSYWITHEGDIIDLEGDKHISEPNVSLRISDIQLCSI